VRSVTGLPAIVLCNIIDGTFERVSARSSGSFLRQNFTLQIVRAKFRVGTPQFAARPEPIRALGWL
jgi:hypothetical protein